MIIRNRCKDMDGHIFFFFLNEASEVVFYIFERKIKRFIKNESCVAELKFVMSFTSLNLNV